MFFSSRDSLRAGLYCKFFKHLNINDKIWLWEFTFAHIYDFNLN